MAFSPQTSAKTSQDLPMVGLFFCPEYNKSGMLFGLDIYVAVIYPKVTQEPERRLEMKNLKCEFCGKTLEEAKACHVNGHVLCSPCMLTDSRTLDLEWPKKGISIDNGLTFIEPEEAIKQKEWAVIAHYMEDEAREQVHHELAPCTNLEFLKRYLEVAECDLVIG